MLRKLFTDIVAMRTVMCTFHEWTCGSATKTVTRNFHNSGSCSLSPFTESQAPKPITKNNNDEQWHELQRHYNSFQLNQTLQRFVDLGFTNFQARELLLKDPELTRYPVADMLQTLLLLHSIGLKEDAAKSALCQCPGLFRLSIPQLKKNFNALQGTLGHRDAKSAVTKNPEILCMNQKTVKENYEYLVSAMGLSPAGIVKLSILSLDIKFIKLRHTILEKAGYYKYPDLLKKDGDEKNPNLADMFATTDEKFVSLFKGLTIEDYVVYEEIMETTNENDTEELEDDDFDYKEENRNSYRRRSRRDRDA